MESRKRKRLVIALTASMFAFAFWFFLLRNTEPTYAGITLSAWLASYKGPGMVQSVDEKTRIELAVRAIGTKGVPYLLDWLGYEVPPWRLQLSGDLPSWLKNKPSVVRFVLGKSAMRASNATLGFKILGTNAVSALPDLVSFMNDAQRPNRCLRAIVALSELHEPGFKALTNALANPQQFERMFIINALLLNAISTPNGTNRILPVLHQALNDQDFGVRTAASSVLNLIGPEAITNAPSK